MQSQKDDNLPTKHPFSPVRGAMEILAYLGAAAASATTMWATVRQNFISKLTRGVFKPLHDERAQKLSDLGQELIKKTIDPSTFNTKEKEIRVAADIVWSTNVERMGMKSFWKKFNYLNKFERAKTLAIGGTIFSVGVGAIVAARERKALYERLTKLEHDSTNQQQPVR